MHLWKCHFFHYSFYPPQRVEIVSFVHLVRCLVMQCTFCLSVSILAMPSKICKRGKMYVWNPTNSECKPVRLEKKKNPIRTQVTKEICILKWSPGETVESTLPEMLTLLQIFWFSSFGIAFRSTFTNHIKCQCHYFILPLLQEKSMRDQEWESRSKGLLCIVVWKAQIVNELETHCNNRKQTILTLHTPQSLRNFQTQTLKCFRACYQVVQGEKK